VRWSAAPLETIAVAGLPVALIRGHKSPAHRKGGEGERDYTAARPAWLSVCLTVTNLNRKRTNKHMPRQIITNSLLN
jgi:hypothetical protein